VRQLCMRFQYELEQMHFALHVIEDLTKDMLKGYLYPAQDRSNEIVATGLDAMLDQLLATGKCRGGDRG